MIAGPVHDGSNASRKQSIRVAKAVAAVVGCAAAVGQITLMREVIVLFNGNELSLGVFLAIWLAWTAAGSTLGGSLARRRTDVRTAIAAAECLSALSIPLAVWIVRGARAHLQAVPGELLGPVPLALASALSLSAFCIVSGCLFALAARMVQQESAVAGHTAVSLAYLFETAGFALGGILTSVLLLGFLNSFQLALIVTLLNLIVACSLYFRIRRWRVGTAIAATALVLVLLVRVAPRMEQATQQRIWKGFRVIGSRESIYGKLTVLESGGLRSIYENGAVLANVPDAAAAEETVHYALLEHPAPTRVLLMGGGINGSIAEALQHPTIKRLDYVELDPALIGIYKQFFPAEYARAFANPRVHVHYADGRRYLKSSRRKFDAVIVSVPEPENAQLNRFYTTEFFRSVRDHLAPGGLVALNLRASEDSIGPALAAFLRCIHHTLHGVFPYVTVIPGATIHMFGATQPGVLTSNPHALMARLKGRGLHTRYVREYFIPFRMMPDRMAQMNELLRSLPSTPTNRDFEPVAYYFGTVLWGAQFKSGYARLLENFAGIRFPVLLAVVAASSLLLILLWHFAAEKRARYVAAWSVVATGYTLMALQLLLLLAFQSICGYVYYSLALLIGMFMAGIALGSLLGLTQLGRNNTRLFLRSAAINLLLLAAASPLLLFLVTQLARSSAASGFMPLTQFIFSALAIFCGMPGGYQFPIASAIHQDGRPTQPGTGTLYALDLLGGCAGALLLAAFLVPLLGFWNTAWMSAIIALAPAASVSFLGFNSARHRA